MLLLSGHGDIDHRVFHDRTTLAGLGSEIALGVTLADFNKDTDADIFLLREELSATPDPEDKRFYWSNSLVDAASSPSTPKAITIGFAREPGPNNHNTMGIGARVAVAVTKPGGTVLRSVQVVDGGTGRGSQGSARLVFGLAGASTAEITVRWPHGQVRDYAQFCSTGQRYTFVGVDGRRCTALQSLQTDQFQPFALGGTHDAANLRALTLRSARSLAGGASIRTTATSDAEVKRNERCSSATNYRAVRNARKRQQTIRRRWARSHFRSRKASIGRIGR